MSKNCENKLIEFRVHLQYSLCLPTVVEYFLSQIVPNQAGYIYFETCGVHNQMHKI